MAATDVLDQQDFARFYFYLGFCARYSIVQRKFHGEWGATATLLAEVEF